MKLTTRITSNPNTMHQEGKVVRIVPTMGLAYLEETTSMKLIGFSLNQVDGFNGESFKELGVVPGALFSFTASLDGRVTYISKKAAAKSVGAS